METVGRKMKENKGKKLRMLPAKAQTLKQARHQSFGQYRQDWPTLQIETTELADLT
jgi:hypothetical protein